MAQEKAAWAEIRCVYEACDASVAAIAARFGISEGAIYRRARRDGWPPRKKLKRGRRDGRSGGEAEKAAPRQRRRARKQAPTADPATDAELIARLYNAMDAKLKRLEARMETNEEVSASESERETRELGSMIRSFEKVTAFAAAIKGRVDKGRKKPAVAAGDAERMREEIAQRLERVCADRKASSKPGAAE